MFNITPNECRVIIVLILCLQNLPQAKKQKSVGDEVKTIENFDTDSLGINDENGSDNNDENYDWKNRKPPRDENVLKFKVSKLSV